MICCCSAGGFGAGLVATGCCCSASGFGAGLVATGWLAAGVDAGGFSFCKKPIGKAAAYSICGSQLLLLLLL
jgi:hypothetical protein